LDLGAQSAAASPQSDGKARFTASTEKPGRAKRRAGSQHLLGARVGCTSGVADSPVVGCVTEVLARDEVGRYQVVVAPFTGAEDRIQDAADQLDAADYEPVHVVAL